MTTLLLFSLLWLFSFVSASLTSLIKHILWLKFSTHIGQAEDMVGGDKDRKSCSVSPWHEAVTYTVWPAHKLSRKWGCLPVLKWSSRLFFEERREVSSYRWGHQGHTWSWVWNPGLLIHRVMFLSSLHLLVPGDSFPASTISWVPPTTTLTYSPPTAELQGRMQKRQRPNRTEIFLFAKEVFPPASQHVHWIIMFISMLMNNISMFIRHNF